MISPVKATVTTLSFVWAKLPMKPNMAKADTNQNFTILIFYYSTRSNVAATIISFFGIRNFHSRIAGVNKGKILTVRGNLRYDTYVSNRARVAASAEEHEVAFFQIGYACNGRALGEL